MAHSTVVDVIQFAHQFLQRFDRAPDVWHRWSFLRHQWKEKHGIIVCARDGKAKMYDLYLETDAFLSVGSPRYLDQTVYNNNQTVTNEIERTQSKDKVKRETDLTRR